MEIIDPAHSAPDKKCYSRQPVRAGATYLGIVMILAGVLWMLSNFAIINGSIQDIIFSWQMLAVVAGGFLLACRSWIAGGLTTGIGLVFLTAELSGVRISLGNVALPLVLIVIGISLLASRHRPYRH